MSAFPNDPPGDVPGYVLAALETEGYEPSDVTCMATPADPRQAAAVRMAFPQAQVIGA